MLWFMLALGTLLAVFTVFVGDWSEMGEVAVRCQRRARRTIGVAVTVLVVVFVIIEIVSPIPFI